MKDKILKQYNNRNSLLVIASYPKKKQTYSKGVCAVSSFTKNTLSGIREQNPGKKVIVLTMILKKPEVYEEDGMLIVRCFERNNPLSYVNILKNALRFNKVKSTLIEFEFASYGNTFATAMISPLTWALRFMGKDITMVIHQVLFDLKKISGHIGISANNPKTLLLNFGLKLFYKFLAMPVRNIVVLEDEFKQKLETLIGKGKVSVIPHGVDFNIKNSAFRKAQIEKRLGIRKNDFVILYFGYLTWYKGVDFLIKALKDTKTLNGKRIKLIVAGGPSFTQENKAHYQRFLNKVNLEAKQSKNAIITGFVDEKDITPIFKSSDLVVFPYRTFMSSSGPLSLALSHEKPFILSKKLELFLNSKDVNHSLDIAGIKKEDILFDLNTKSLVSAIKNVSATKNHKKMIRFSKTLGKERSFTRLGLTYNKLISEDFDYVANPAISLS